MRCESWLCGCVAAPTVLLPPLCCCPRCVTADAPTELPPPLCGCPAAPRLVRSNDRDCWTGGKGWSLFAIVFSVRWSLLYGAIFAQMTGCCVGCKRREFYMMRCKLVTCWYENLTPKVYGCCAAELLLYCCTLVLLCLAAGLWTALLLD